MDSEVTKIQMEFMVQVANAHRRVLFVYSISACCIIFVIATVTTTLVEGYFSVKASDNLSLELEI